MTITLGPAQVSVWRFVKGRPKGAWKVKVYDYHHPLFGVGRRFGRDLGWGQFQPSFNVNLGRFGLGISWRLVPNGLRGTYRRSFRVDAYLFPGSSAVVGGDGS